MSENPNAGPQGKGYNPDTAFTLEARKNPQAVAFSGQMSTPMWDFDLSQTLQRKNPQAVAFAEPQRGELFTSDVSNALTKGGGKPGQGYAGTLTSSAVRRPTPEECEALQGFPRSYTAVPHRGKTAADGPRYKALGNSMAVPVMAWIGRRIALVDALAHPARQACAS